MDKTSTVQRSLYYYDLYALNKNDKTGKYKKSCSVINNPELFTEQYLNR